MHQITEAFPWDEAPRYLIRDRDRIFGAIVTRRLRAMGIRDKPTASASPWQNAYAERWVRSVKEECLSKVILFGERSPRRALSEYVEHYHAERNHQGKDNVLLFPRDTSVCRTGPVQCRERLGGLLRYYHQEAARSRAHSSILNSDSTAAIRRSRSRGRPLRPVVPTHAPGKLADALRPTGSSTVPIF